jgi:Ca2+-binding RTX toxin-like protein
MPAENCRPAASGRSNAVSPRLRRAAVPRAVALIGGLMALGLVPSAASATVIVGTPGPDHLVATGADGDTLYGGGGADTLLGGPGPDIIYGVRSGNKIDGAGGNNYIEGGTGDDTITAADGNNTVLGGSGDDSITLGNGNNWVDPGGGLDTVTLGNGNNVINGGAGGMILHAGSGNNTVYYRSGPDQIELGGGVNTIYIGIVGQFADINCGGNPASVLYVNAAQDPGAAHVLSAVNEGKVHGCPTITTFDGPAVPISITAPSKTAPFNLVGTDAVDKLYGGHGGGFIDGKGGNNVLWADREHDTGGAFAKSKTTTIQAGDGDNLIYGGRGTNKITVGNGNNFIRAGAFNNSITTGSGDNVVRLQGDGFNTVTFNGGSSYIETFTRGPRATVNCDANAKAIVIYGVRKPKTNCTTVVNAKTKLGEKLQVQGVPHIPLSDPVVSFPIAPGQDGYGVARPAITSAI